MLALIIIIGILIISTTFSIIYIMKSKNEDDAIKFLLTFFIFISGMIIAFIIWIMTISSTPQPIDVYRGKTKLKITEIVVDSTTVKKDSVVVFK